MNLKIGRRRWLNFVDLLSSLHSEFPSIRMYVNDPTVVSFTREVAMLQSTTVLIAHNGAISANLIFLQDLATVIVCDVFSDLWGTTRMEQVACCTSYFACGMLHVHGMQYAACCPHALQDGHLYSALGHIRVLYYMVKANDIPDPASHSPGDSATMVNITRMTKLVRIGLEQTSQHLAPEQKAEDCSTELGVCYENLNVAAYISTRKDLGAQPETACMYSSEGASGCLWEVLGR